MGSEKRKIYIGADAAGVALKAEIKSTLAGYGYEVTDVGAYDTQSSHYPEFAAAVCREVQKDPDGRFGILICGTGIGMSMAANKFRHIRAAVCGDTFSARMTRMHNNANVLCMGARVIGPGLANDICELFINTEFESGGRHTIRVNMISEIEDEQVKAE